MVIVHFCIGLLLLSGIQTIAQSCPGLDDLYIKRGVNTYCKKIYNCKPGHEILPCDKTCEEEKCVPCPQSKAQPHLSHSDDRRLCFTPARQCNKRDTIPIENGTYSPSCAVQKYCECNTSKCFYGNPCICERNFEPCGVNEEMNSKGECVKCKEGYVKPYPGCEKCERIVPTPPQINTSPTIGKVTDKPIHSTTAAHKTTITSVDSKSPGTTADTDTGRPVITRIPLVGKPTAPPESDGTTLIIVFVVVVLVLVVAIIVVVLCIRKYGRHRFLAKICRGREPPDAEAGGRNHVNGDVRQPPEPADNPVPEETVLRESLLRMTSYPSDSGYEHHPSLDSQISQTSHISVSTPVQATDSGDDLHPLLRTYSQDASTYTPLPSSNSPITGPESISLRTTDTLDTPSTVGSMDVSECIPEEINIDVKGTIPTPPFTRDMESRHEDNPVILGRTAAENEEDTEEKHKLALDSLQFQKQSL